MAVNEQSALKDFTGAAPGSADEDAMLDKFLNFEPEGAGADAETETPETLGEETYIVQEGDTLSKIATEKGIPLEDIARDNNIEDVNVIMPGQELKIKKPGAVETDISAGGEDDFIEGLTFPEGGTSPDGVLGTPPGASKTVGDDLSDAGTPTDKGGIDFGAKPAIPTPEVAEAKIDGEPVEEEPGLGEMPVATDEVASEENRKLKAQSISAALSEEPKRIFDKVIAEIDKLGVEPPTDIEKYYDNIAKNINEQIQKYDEKISEIAEEKRKPTFEGWDKFLAVLGAAMGAYGSAMTGTPNFALKIIDQEIDRDIQSFMKSKEIRTKALADQRMELIMRRGELLQMAQNRVNQLMQTAGYKLQKEELKAKITEIEQGIIQRQDELNQQKELLIFTKMVDVYTADQSFRASLSKEQRKKMVNSFTAEDSKGNAVLITGYVARDVDTAKKLTDQQKDALKVLSILDQLNELHQSPTRFIPAWAGGSDRSKINTLTADLELLLKERMGMGANYSEYEQSRIKAIVPGTDITDMLFQHKTKSDQLRDEVIQKLQNDKGVESFGEAGNTKEADKIIKSSKSNIEKFGGKKVRN